MGRRAGWSTLGTEDAGASLGIHGAVIKAGGSVGEQSGQRFRRRYRDTLTQGDAECPPPKKERHSRRTRRSKSRNLLERLRAFETETLRFMSDPRVAISQQPG